MNDGQGNGAGALGPVLYILLRDKAREHGYALAVHGSMGRDFDFIAVAWTEDASEPIDLVKDLWNVAGLLKWEASNAEPTLKPHGRKAWAIQIGVGPYIDLSVIGPNDKN